MRCGEDSFSRKPGQEEKERIPGNQLALFRLRLRRLPELLNEYAITARLLGLPYHGI
jgi:hypothetical protein